MHESLSLWADRIASQLNDPLYRDGVYTSGVSFHHEGPWLVVRHGAAPNRHVIATRRTGLGKVTGRGVLAIVGRPSVAVHLLVA